MKKISMLPSALIILGCFQGNQVIRESHDNLKSIPVVQNGVAKPLSGSINDDSILPAGSMETPRAVHCATLLNNGRVLITGGFAENALSSAEIYNPESGTFKPVGNMNVARVSHTATLLPDGKVLIAGGYNGSYLSSTEIYDPISETFTLAGTMTTARSGHTATVLNNGKILFAGGTGIGWSFLQSAELYNIKTGTFSSTGSMTTAREAHTATLMKNGKVLITGGHKGRRSEIKIYSGAEIYDPSSQKFTLTGSMTKIRHKHDAVMMEDGRVLITGGSDERDYRGSYKSTEIYNPVSGTFEWGGNMNYTRFKHYETSVLLRNGNVLIAGGNDRAEIYDPKTKTFTLVSGNMKTDRLFSCATLLTNEQVLITGGYDEKTNVTANAWLFTYKMNAKK